MSASAAARRWNRVTWAAMKGTRWVSRGWTAEYLFMPTRCDPLCWRPLWRRDGPPAERWVNEVGYGRTGTRISRGFGMMLESRRFELRRPRRFAFKTEDQ